MATSDTRLITVSCDIPGCTETIACGSDPTWAYQHGWRTVSAMAVSEDLVLADNIDLCPTHIGDLIYFFTVGENGDEAVNDEAAEAEDADDETSEDADEGIVDESRS